MPLSKHKPKQALIRLGILLAMLVSIASFAKIPAIVELHIAGLHGRVHAWNNVERRSHKIALNVPKNAPIIISDYHSSVGANGLKRTGKHRGVDMFAEVGSPVIAAADGKVVKAKNDRCWGPTILVKHGLDKDGYRIYALYGHVRNINVKVGQRIKRGQQIAEMGEDIFTNCGGGLHHLHFQISYSSMQIPLGWGWASFVADGAMAPNPHKYWENGEGKITCFEKGKRYSKSGLTYPLPCLNKPQLKRPDKTMLVQIKPKKRVRQNTLENEFIASGVTHFSLTDNESMTLFSSMSDWPE